MVPYVVCEKIFALKKIRVPRGKRKKEIFYCRIETTKKNAYDIHVYVHKKYAHVFPGLKSAS